MAKAFFRFLRGELNGFYLVNLHNTLNKSTEDIKSFLIDFANQQFEQGKITDETLYNLGKFAGIFLPRITLADSSVALRMSDTKIVDGTQFSERGLFYTPLESFRYYHLNLDSVGYFYFERTTQEQYEDDINTLATINKKSSMIGDETVLGFIDDDNMTIYNSDGTVKKESIKKSYPTDKAFNRFYGDQFSVLSEGDSSAIDLNTRIVLSESYEEDGIEYSERGLYKPPMPDYPDINTLANEEERSSLVGNEDVLGYISEDAEDVIDAKGLIDLSKVSSVPPENKAYSEYYGNQFLYLAEGNIVYEDIDPSIFMELFKSLQWIRYNGISTKSLVDMISILCPDGLVKVTSIESSVDGNLIYIYYDYDGNAEVPYKSQRKALLETLVNEKFKQVILIENEV